MGSVALGIAAWILLDRKERRADVLAAVCLAASLACSGVGIPIVVGTTVRLALTRSGFRRWWVIVGPVLLYGIWYLAYGDPQGDSSNLSGLPAFVWEAARSATAALASGSLALGAVIVIAVAALAVGACVVRRRVPAAVGGTVALLVSDWALTGYARGGAGDAGASRYVYVGAVFVVLLAADSIAELLPLRRYVGDAVRVAFPVLAVLCIWANASTFRSAASGLREASGYVGAELRALELTAATGTVDPAFHPDTTRIPQIAAGPYLAAVADLGSPAMATVALPDQPAGVREAIDRVALGAAGTSVFTPDPADTCTIDPAVTPAPTPLTGAAIVVAGDAPVEIRLIRTAAQPPAEPTATVDPRSRVLVDPPLNPDAGDWTLATTSSAPFAVCSA